MNNFLSIKKLSVSADKKNILKNFSLTMRPGEIHVIMGPNGSGKSTLCNALMGHPSYTVTAGSIVFHGKNIVKMDASERARLGMFLSFQQPREIPGVSLASMLRMAKHAQMNAKEKFDRKQFIADLKIELDTMKLGKEFLTRPLNENASGGERKRLEMVQLAMLKPKLAILDEIDSGLDVDALKLIAKRIQKMSKENRTAFLIITHYQRLLTYIKPDRVHILVNGTLVKSGKADIVKKIEKDGYQIFSK